MELISWNYQFHPKYADGQIGDLLIDLPSREKAWIELKFVYAYEYTRAKLYKCNSYPKYLLSTSGRDHSVAKDFLKLEHVTPDRADFVAMVMLGFDHAGRYPISIADIEELKQIVGYSRHDWCELHDSWAEQHVLQDTEWYADDPNFRVRCWVWWQNVGR